MSLSGFFQFIIGFILGTIVFSAGIGGGIYFFLMTMSVKPAKPDFPAQKSVTMPANESSQANTDSSPNNSSTSDQNQTQEAVSENDDLPAGAYRARVNWSTGLSLRSEPDKEAERIGGIGYNWEIIVLNDSNDRQWQRIRIPSSGQEGWVKAGNVEKIDEED